MLEPDARSLYTSAVTPPPGYLFDQALATTFSLDPATLLSLPTHLALSDRSATSTVDPIKTLESLRRLSDRFSVYVDHAGIKPPSGDNGPLFGLLESMLIPVKAPRGGVFHPKIWVLRFVQPETEASALIRLLVLSRNITYDRSWDISLQLEGRPGRRSVAANRPLVELLQSLPVWSTQPVAKARKLQALQLAEEVRKTVWELPEGFEEVSFHVLGTGSENWLPSTSSRLAVISPFVNEAGLSWLRDRTGHLVAVVSRPDELNQLDPATLKLADTWYTLDEDVETDDGEEPNRHDTVGLHAKAYVLESPPMTRLLLGSANATRAAVLKQINIEILVELVGRKNRIGGVETLLSENGLGAMMKDYTRPDEILPLDDEEVSARKALEAARNALVEAGLKVFCKAADDAWQLQLVSPQCIPLKGIGRLKAWPITVTEDRAVDVSGLGTSGKALLGKYATASVTGLVAFDLVSEIRKKSLRMVLNLPVDGLPEDRDDAIFKLFLTNREDFLRYLLLLIGEHVSGFIGKGGILGGGNGNGAWAGGFSGEVPILEELARAFSRHPDKLEDVRAVVKRLVSDQASECVVPPEFLELWAVFEAAMAGAGK
jgi:hypothetical protein